MGGSGSGSGTWEWSLKSGSGSGRVLGVGKREWKREWKSLGSGKRDPFEAPKTEELKSLCSDGPDLHSHLPNSDSHLPFREGAPRELPFESPQDRGAKISLLRRQTHSDFHLFRAPSQLRFPPPRELPENSPTCTPTEPPQPTSNSHS